MCKYGCENIYWYFWTHLSWHSRNHRVFQAFQRHTPTSKRPSSCPDGEWASLPPWLSSLEPQPPWGSLCCLGAASSLHQCPVSLGLWIGIRLQSPCMQVLLASILLSSHFANILWSDRHTWWASSQMPLPGGLPTALSTPGARLALRNQKPEPLRWWSHCAVGNLVAFQGPPSVASPLQRPVFLLLVSQEVLAAPWLWRRQGMGRHSSTWKYASVHSM